MWPTENDYIKAVTRVNPSPFSLLNTKRISVIKDENDEPIMRFGNNSVVFKVSINERLYALKCFTKEINNQFQYLSAVQKFVDDLRCPYLQPFELHESEIYVIKNENSYHGTYCVLLMPWIEGETLYDQVKKCCEENDMQKLEDIFFEFKKMASWLLQQRFVHGDITAENIMIARGDKMMLVDYDNILFEELKLANGHSPVDANYQHPKRNLHVINLAADQFSILVLAISFRALQFKPELFSKYNYQSGLLFSADTLRMGTKSTVYQELETIKDAYLQNLLRLFSISITKQSIEVPMLATCIMDDDPSSYSRLLEIEMEELKKELENAAARIQVLQADVAKELVSKEKLAVENTRLKETIAQIEEKKKKNEAIKKGVSLALAGLTCIAMMLGVFLFAPPEKQRGNLVVKIDSGKKTLPMITNALPRKDSGGRKVEDVPTKEIQGKENVVLNVEPSVKRTTSDDSQIASNNLSLEEKPLPEKSKINTTGQKYQSAKSHASQVDYDMFRKTGF